ncbi:unnamed protein product, partial [Closterium sp. NIES-54]
MFLTRQNMTGFTRASRPPSTDACRSARCRSAHQAEPRRPAEPRCPTEPHCPACIGPAATAAMASPTVLTFDAEGRAIDFDVWVDDLQLFLQCDSRDVVYLFDHTSDVSTAPTATADSTVRSQWTTRDAVARLAVRSHLPPAERAHFGQYKTAQSLYDAVVARYSSHAIAALSRLMLLYLFPDLATFATVADLITHLRTIDAHYYAALRTKSGLRLLLVGGAATARARGARVVEGMAGAAAEAAEEAEGVAVEVRVVRGVGASVAAVEVVEAAVEVVEAAAEVVEAAVAVVKEAAAVAEVAVAVVLAEVQPRNVEALVVASASSSRVPVRPRQPSSF